MSGLALGRDGVALGGDLAELAADDEQHVGLLDQRVGDAVVAAEQAGAERIGAGDRALAGHGVRDRESRGRAAKAASTSSAAARCARRRRRSMSGRLASASSAAARAVVGAVRPAAERGRRLVAPDRRRNPRPRTAACAWQTSSGTSTHDRPRPARGRDREGAAHQLGDAARRPRCGSAPCTPGAGSRSGAHSWVMFFQECRRWVSPTSATIGVPALSASTSPVTRFVAPGPSVASQGRPAPTPWRRRRRRTRRRARR